MDDEERERSDEHGAGPLPADRRSLLKGAGAVVGWGALSSLLPSWARMGSAEGPADGLLEAGEGPVRLRETFEGTGRETWGPPWTIDGVANLPVRDARGHLEAGTNIYPSDKRAVAFARDHRFQDGTVSARFERAGVGAGLVVRRVGPGRHYAAVLDREAGGLVLVARQHREERVLARAPLDDVPVDRTVVSLTAEGTDPTRLRARLGVPGAQPVVLEAEDGAPDLQVPGDPGVLATAETGFRAGPDWRTPIGTQSARAAWVVDAATQVQDSKVPITEARRAATELASTAVVDEVLVRSPEAPATTVPSAHAATTLQPSQGGARVGVVADVPALVEVEVSLDGSFDPPDAVVDAGRVNDLLGAFATLDVDAHDQQVHWRPRLTRNGETATGPVRRFRALPAPGSGEPVRLAIGACATQYAASFPAIAEADPDVFVWQGDINYIDASGPLAQTRTGYAGMWTDVLDNPDLAGILERSAFATTRDDHDYGKNDSWRETLTDHGVESYEKTVNPDPYYRFSGGLVDVWVLDQRQWRDDPAKPDDADKTLVGAEQKAWLKDTLAASTAPFKLVCSPDPLFNVPNASNSWAKGYSTERDEILDHVDRAVDGRVVWVTGDTHSGSVTRREDEAFLEVRAAPMDIPGPGQHDASSGEDVVFSEQGRYFCLVDVLEEAGVPTMEIQLERGDGTTAWEDTLAPE